MSALESLTPDECWELLRTQRVGRIGFDRGRGPRIHPVSYAVDGRDILLTTSEESELGAFVRMFADGAHVSFETDQLDESGGEQWSVLVGGRLSADAPSTRVGTDAPAGHDELVVRLTPVEVTGRRVGGSLSTRG